MNYRVFALITLVAAPLLAIMADSMAGSRHSLTRTGSQIEALPPMQSSVAPPVAEPPPSPQPTPAMSTAPAFGQPTPGAGEPMLQLGEAEAQDAPDADQSDPEQDVSN